MLKVGLIGAVFGYVFLQLRPQNIVPERWPSRLWKWLSIDGRMRSFTCGGWPPTMPRRDPNPHLRDPNLWGNVFGERAATPRLPPRPRRPLMPKSVRWLEHLEQSRNHSLKKMMVPGFKIYRFFKFPIPQFQLSSPAHSSGADLLLDRVATSTTLASDQEVSDLTLATCPQLMGCVLCIYVNLVR